MKMKFSPEMSIENATSTAINALDAELIRAVTGKSRALFYKTADYDNDHHHIQMRDAISLEAMMHCIGQGGQFREAFDHAVEIKVAVLGGSMAHQPADIDDRFIEGAKTLGRIAEQIHDSKRPDSPGGHRRTPAERENIIAHVRAHINAMQKLIKDLEADAPGYVHDLNKKEAS